MSIAIADIRFTFHDYDPRGDTLFLSVGSPPAATWPEDTADTPSITSSSTTRTRR